MHRSGAIVVAVAVVVSTVAVMPAAGLAPASESLAAHATDTPPVNESAMAPGAQLMGVVHVQHAEFDGELETRSFGIQLARAATANAKAAVIKTQVTALADRLATLEARKQELDAARANGTLSDEQYRARVAGLAARTHTLMRLTNHTEAQATALPAATLQTHDVNVTAIRDLKHNASRLSGPETAAIARSIAGDNAGGPIAATNRPSPSGRPATSPQSENQPQAENETQPTPPLNPGGDNTPRGPPN